MKYMTLVSATKFLVALHFLPGNPICVYADESALNLCMARADAIRTTAEVRDTGVSQQEYEVRYANMVGRPLNAVENEVVILAYATPNYSPSQLHRIAVVAARNF